MEVLVTGGAGFIGSHICAQLLNEGHRVVAYDTAGPGPNTAPFQSKKDFTLVRGDIRDADLLKQTLAKHSITYLSHQAAIGSVPQSIDDPLLVHDVNVNGTLNVLWAAKEAGVKRVAMAISSAIYGNAALLPILESLPYAPKSPYAVTKVANDLYAKVFYDTYGLETVGLRYFNVYGPRQDPNGAYAAVIPRFLQSALQNTPIKIHGNGKQMRDFVYVKDAAEANVLALTQPAAKVAGKSFNICSGKGVSIKELAAQITLLTHSKSEIVYAPSRAGDILHSMGSPEYAKKHLGFVAKTKLVDGLKATVAWFEKST